MTAPPPAGDSWAQRLTSWRAKAASAAKAAPTAKASPAAKDAPPATERAFDPSSWTGALIVMAAATAVLWVVQILNVSQHYRLNRFGLRPRRIDGLWGVLTEPFLHDSWPHLLYNSVSFAIIGWVVLLAGLRSWLLVSAIVIVSGGLLSWLAAPNASVPGASVLVFGWLGYLIARAYFVRKIRWVLTAVLVLAFFGGLLGGLLPGFGGGGVGSWQSHLCGFAAGILAGALLHPRRRARPRRSPHPPPVS